MTITRPMFPPVDPTRRRLLSAAATGGAGLVLAACPAFGAANAPATPAASPDPVLATIDAHWNALANCTAGELSVHGMEDEARNAIMDDLYDAERDAFADLCESVPTTPAGTRAWVSYMAELAESDFVWRFDVEYVVAFLTNLNAALAEQGGQA